MRILSKLLFILPLSVWAGPPGLEVTQNVRTFIQDYCVSCHNAEKQKGKVRLDNLDKVIANGTSAQIWQDVLDIINVGNMPPEEAKKIPEDKVLAEAVGLLTEDLLKARRLLADKGGETVIRRMNELEYINSIEYMTGIRLADELVPDDENGKSFNTLGWYQTFSPATLEAYQNAAEFALSKILLEGNKPYQEKKIIRQDKAAEQRRHKQQTLNNLISDHEKALKVPKDTSDLKKYGFKNETFYKKALKPIDQQFGVHALKNYINNPNTKTGVVVYEMSYGPLDAPIAFKADFRAEYIIRTRIAMEKGMEDSNKFAALIQDGPAVGYAKITGTMEDPQILEVRIKPSEENTDFRFKVLNKTELRRANLKRINQGKYVPGMWLDWIEVEGPFYNGKYLKKYQEILQGADEKTLSESDAENIIRKFAQKAFRGYAVQEEFIQKLKLVYKQELSIKESKTEALVKPLAAILTSPEFLFLGEEKSAKKDSKKVKLEAHEMASRLSYMFLKEPPTQQVLENASKLLEDESFLDETIDAFMANPKSDRFIDEFFNQWLGLKEYDHVVLQPKQFEFFDNSKQYSVKKQPLEFIKYIIKNDLKLTNIIDSDFTVTNAIMAAFYEDFKNHKNIPGDRFEKISLTEENRHRGGILGMPAVQTIGSTGERNAPVERGAWILRKLLNSPPPPPPPNVDQLENRDKTLTIRQKLEKHKDIPQCYSCHKKIDDLGLAMENFDVIGRWQKQAKNDTAGYMPDGTKFENFMDMKVKLMSHKDKMIEGMVEALIAYSLSRESEFSDQDFVEEMVQVCKENGYRFMPLLKSFIKHEKFTCK